MEKLAKELRVDLGRVITIVNAVIAEYGRGKVFRKNGDLTKFAADIVREQIKIGNVQIEEIKKYLKEERGIDSPLGHYIPDGRD